MRMISKLLSGALTLALAMGVLVAPAFADEGNQAKTYRVTLYAGEQGTVNGSDKIAFDVAPGASVSFDGIQIAIKDGSKYYAKGIRPAEMNSGYEKYYVAKPDANGVMQGSVTVDKDYDYVVAYGLTSERVQYTVRFVNEAGADIADPVTYWIYSLCRDADQDSGER